MDLPSEKDESNLYYIRRQDSAWGIPPSYRTGLVFFAAVLLLSVFSLNAVDAYHLAESRFQFLGAQILQEFDQLSEPFSSDSSESEDQEASEFPSLAQSPSVFDHDPLSTVLDSETLRTPQELAHWRVYIAKGFDAFGSFVKAWPREEQPILLSQMKTMHRFAQQALEHWQRILSRAEKVDFVAFSEEQQEMLLKNLGTLSELSSFLSVFDAGYEEVTSILGLHEPQRILIFIQDPYQRRATGGLLSAAVEILIENGEILAWRPFHVREYDAQLRANLQAPVSLQQLTDRWTLETANAFVDLSDSAEQIHWFWQREARSTVDLIALVSAPALERILKESSLDLSDELAHFGLLWSLKSTFGEEETLKSLAEMALHESFQVLRDPDASIQLWPTIQELVSQKQLMLYSTNPDTQRKIENAGASAVLPDMEQNEDFIMVSSLNLNNAPTDYWINDDFELHTAVKEDGTIKHWLRIERKHSDQELPSSPIVAEMRNWRGKTHKSLVRVLVPKGSKLLGADGISLQDIRTQQTSKGTVWSFPMDIASGATESLSIAYELPWTFDTSSVDNYRLHWLKQPGTKTPTVEHRLKLPAELSIFQQIPEEQSLFLHQDRVYAIVAGRNP